MAVRSAEGWVVWSKGIVRSLLSLAVLSSICLLEISLFAKLAAIFGWLWLQFTIQIFAGVIAELGKIAADIRLWTRLTFIAVHIRNETAGLEPAIDRLASDAKLEAPNPDIEGAVGTVGVIFEIATTCLVLLAVLYVLVAQAELRQMVVVWLSDIAAFVGFLDKGTN